MTRWQGDAGGHHYVVWVCTKQPKAHHWPLTQPGNSGHLPRLVWEQPLASPPAVIGRLPGKHDVSRHGNGNRDSPRKLQGWTGSTALTKTKKKLPAFIQWNLLGWEKKGKYILRFTSANTLAELDHLTACSPIFQSESPRLHHEAHILNNTHILRFSHALMCYVITITVHSSCN